MKQNKNRQLKLKTSKTKKKHNVEKLQNVRANQSVLQNEQKKRNVYFIQTNLLLQVHIVGPVWIKQVGARIIKREKKNVNYLLVPIKSNAMHRMW